jgi:hypothetical protein
LGAIDILKVLGIGREAGLHELLPSGYRQVFGVVCAAGSRMPSSHEKENALVTFQVSLISLVEGSTMMTNTK